MEYICFKSLKNTLTADSSGHFKSQGNINGQVMQFVVDTGATVVAIGRPDAERMGLPYLSGQPVRMGTANGVGTGWRLKLDSVRIGDVEVFGVEAIVTSQPMPFVLLGIGAVIGAAVGGTIGAYWGCGIGLGIGHVRLGRHDIDHGLVGGQRIARRRADLGPDRVLA